MLIICFVFVCTAARPVPSSAAVSNTPTHPHPPGEHRRDQRSRGERHLLWPSVCPVGSTSLRQTKDQRELTGYHNFLLLNARASAFSLHVVIFMHFSIRLGNETYTVHRVFLFSSLLGSLICFRCEVATKGLKE